MHENGKCSCKCGKKYFVSFGLHDKLFVIHKITTLISESAIEQLGKRLRKNETLKRFMVRFREFTFLGNAYADCYLLPII